MHSHRSLFRYGFFLIIIPVLMVTASCGTLRTTPATVPMQPNVYPRFKTNQQFSIINAQTSVADSPLGNAQGVGYLANYHKWTDQAIDILREELKKSGGGFSKQANKELMLSVVDANIVKATWGSWCYLTLKVETGHGYSAEYKTKSKGSSLRVPTGISVACGRAITSAVGNMLNDKAILTYIQS